MIFLISVTASLALGILLYRKTFYHFRSVVSGKLYRSGCLKSTFALIVVCKIFKINTIINLRSVKERNKGDWYEREKTFCEKYNIQLINIPLQIDQPPSDIQVDDFLKTIEQEDKCCLVHCEVGIMRTGMMVSAFLKNTFNMSSQEIWKNHFPLYGHRLHRHPRVINFVDSYVPSRYRMLLAEKNFSTSSQAI